VVHYHISARSSLGWNIASIGISTIAPRTRTNRPGNVSSACNGSSPPATLSGFSRPTDLLPNTSVYAGIGLPRPHIVTNCRQDSKSGRRSRLQSWLLKRKIR
jgi:hypothetical protein